MFKVITIMSCLFILTSLHGGNWVNAFKKQGDGKTVQLLQDSKQPAYQIVMPDQEEADAANLLKSGLELLTGGVDFPINPGKSSLKKIILGKNLPELGADGYSIVIDQDNNITLHGGSRKGVVYAAVSLLVEDFGLRYYTPNSPPASPAGVITNATVLPRSFVPAFMQRCVYSFWGLSDDKWMLMNRTHKGEFGKFFVHTFFDLIPPSEFSASHPEYFALSDGKRVTRWEDGQLCMTNPEVRKIVIERINNILDKNPQIDFFAVDPNDAAGFCNCPGCDKINKAEGAYSGALLQFVNAIAAEVAKKHPDVNIVTNAYRDSIKAPRTTIPADNVVVRLCLNNRIGAYPFCFVDETSDLELLNDWSQKTKRLLIWDYMTDFQNYLTPRADLPVLEHNIKLYQNKKVQGVMMQTNYTNNIGTLSAMRSWVCAQLLWNPNLDVQKLADDYLAGFFGEKVGLFMIEYKNLLNQEWEYFHSKNKPGQPFKFSTNFYEQGMNILAKAKNAAAGNETLVNNIELEELTLYYYLLNQGLTKESEIPGYKDTINKFTELIKKHKIDHLIEGGYGKAMDRVSQWQDGVSLLKYTRNIKPDTIVLPVTWNVYNTDLVSDKQSLTGKVKKQQAGWSIQWRVDTFPKITNGKYKVRIRLKGDASIVVGAYNDRKCTYALSRVIETKELDKGKYKWIDCGVVDIIIGNQMFIYTTPNGTLGNDYIDSIELVPERVRKL
jgi:hypothetical protein